MGTSPDRDIMAQTNKWILLIIESVSVDVCFDHIDIKIFDVIVRLIIKIDNATLFNLKHRT